MAKSELARKKDYDHALADFDEAIRVDPRCVPAYNDRAGLWATCPVAKYRDGPKAVESATRACELSGWKDPQTLRTLALACAEAGDFEAAVKWAEQALELFADEENQAISRGLLELFQAHKPYHGDPELHDQAG